MILFRLKFSDKPGALARVIQALSEAGVNTEKLTFNADKERQGFLSTHWVGRGALVVRDEERDTVHQRIVALAKKRLNLGFEIVGMYYDVTILLPNRPGVLAEELKKLAKLDVDIRYVATTHKNEHNEVFVNFIFDCSPDRYNLAKQALGNTIQDESPFSANAVYDGM
jgi:ACT domain-containing protein